jgi:UDP-N-acetylmuramate dehydrogenase
MTASHSGTIDLEENVALKPHTTFKIGGPARFFAHIADAQQAKESLTFANRERAPVFILGGGSNILVSDRGFAGLVLHPARRGIQEQSDDGTTVVLRISAAETWDDAVARTVERGWWGIENLSHIPGQSGAALVQNIGAYGQQLSDVLTSAEVMDLSTGAVVRKQAADCGLAYRRSIFNSTAKGNFLILDIGLKLSRRPRPDLGYRDVKAYFDERSVEAPSQAQIREAIVGIRDRKFPYPREERGGNAGSFFKNPNLDEQQFRAASERVGTRFGFAALERLLAVREGHTGSGPLKLPAALLIDLCGLKGFTIGSAQVNPSQPLVILNLGGATSHHVLTLAGHIRRTVRRETGVLLGLEPELVGFTGEEIASYLNVD